MSAKPNTASSKLLKLLTDHSLRNFNYKRLQKIANLQLTSRPPTHGFCDESQYIALRDSSSLGPGHYNTPNPPSGPSYNFGYAIRFRNSPSPIQSNRKASNIIKTNKQMQVHTPEYKKIILEKQISQKRLNMCISRETKRIITIERKEKIKDSINEKFNKAEMKKIKKQKISICKSFSALITTIFICQIGKTRLDKRKEHCRKIQKYLFGIAVICRALGKFRRMMKNAKLRVAIKLIRKVMPKYVRRFKAKLRSRNLKVVSDIFENFSKYVSVERINFMINFKIKKIQRMIRNFLCVTRFRKHSLRLFWNKLDFKFAKIPENVQHYYISSYLRIKISDYVQKQFDLKRYVTFLTTDEKALVGFKEFDGLGRVENPIFRVFLGNSIKRLIAKAYDEKSKWGNINFANFGIVIEKKLPQAEKKRGTIFKHQMNKKNKRGTVTFKLNKGD